MKRRILLVDDDRVFCRHFETLAARTFRMTTVHGYDEAEKRLRRGAFDAVLLDIDLGEKRNGMDLLGAIRAATPELPVVMLSGDDSTDTILQALRAGADGFTPKHCRLEILQAQIEQNIENALWRQHARAIEAAPVMMLGNGPAMAELRREIAEVAGTSLRVLIRGESGSGKELVAHAVHAASERGRGRFVAVNAAAGSEELFDDLLFGHERGAFTGADRPRVGKLELATGGTLFLDEVGKMSLDRQAKLLRVLEEGGFERVGGAETVPADVRFIFASNEDLEKKVQDGSFYPDFYYRVREYEIRVPPLRERLEDIPELARHLLGRFCAGEGRPEVEITPDGLAACHEHGWPGNVRELDSVLKRAAIGARGPLGAEEIRESISRLRADVGHTAGGAVTLEQGRLDWERGFLKESLQRYRGDVERAATELGISRSTLYAKLQQHGLGRSGVGRTDG